ncbi:hypothetical protein LUZ60_015307 [Juncus effusus]|nr:hypothetical protein LUZ60_015307 [Juncus effusus]
MSPNSFNPSTHPKPASTNQNRVSNIWQSCVSPALRMALACTIIGVTTVYGPIRFRQLIEFPAFSYVVTILIISEATLGEVLHGATCSIFGTVLGILPAMLTMFIIKPVGFSIGTTTVAVFLTAFVISWTESMEILAKRIALGETVLIYVATFKHSDLGGHGFMHQAHVVASMALGVAASILALVFPYPRLALHEVKEKNKLYIEMAIERIRVLVEGFCAEDRWRMAALVSQSRCFGASSTKLLNHIKTKQGQLQWERSPLKFSKPHNDLVMTRDALQAIEMHLKGMQIAQTSTNLAPIKSLHVSPQDNFETNLSILKDQISLKLLKPNYFNHHQKDSLNMSFQNMRITPQDPNESLSSLFFLFCMNLLLKKPLTSIPTDGSQENQVAPTATEPADSDSVNEEPNAITRRKNKPIFSSNLSKQRLIASLKCSFSLSLAVLFGLLFSRENAYWAGLIVATTFSPLRQSTFKLANLRAQGTGLGSVYGVFGSLISQHLMELRFLVLLPCIIFTGFLRHNKMYGQAGSVATIISAIVILGRKNYGSPMSFTINRICETFIGLACSIFVELVLQPTRASTLAREQLSKTLDALKECIVTMKWENKLEEQVSVLKKYITEADSEPNLWFLPFRTTCYQKLHESLSKMADFMYFMNQGLEFISHELGESLDNEIKERISVNVEKFNKVACASIKCIELVLCTSNKNSKSNGVEMGDLEQGSCEFDSLSEMNERCEKYEMEIMEVFEMEGMKGEFVLCVGCIVFCLRGLLKEMKEIEKGAIELTQWENPGRNVNMNEIYCKLREQNAK